MHHAIRRTTALFAVIAAMGIAHAEGGPGDSGVGGPDGSASSATAARHGSTTPKKVTHKKRANAASGAKADGPMGSASVGKGG
ncbi:hypothetical protein [Scleromatobacter humisilvae]|uniref:Uncharacterized protein n=1 Tax=Scleromatobacter humisilvae TaxID=2897159 RepID=A0A9X1YPD2_9BURK|nr:hypothetical protein [Scleromatobacter humisilvae]MCK9689592.1 hypothetical protein [Scleromatobacter humisilvae]